MTTSYLSTYHLCDSDLYDFIFVFVFTAELDNIPEQNTTVYNHSNTRQIWLKWLEPPQPNGIIITYDIKLHKTDVANVSNMSKV